MGGIGVWGKDKDGMEWGNGVEIGRKEKLGGRFEGSLEGKNRC